MARGVEGQSTQANSWTEVVHLTLPAGSYVVSFRATPRAPTSSGVDVQCQLFRASTQNTVLLDEWWGWAPPNGFAGLTQYSGLVNLPITANLLAVCGANSALSWGTTRITAIKVATSSGGLGRADGERTGNAATPH